jgi:hypothetical protein
MLTARSDLASGWYFLLIILWFVRNFVIIYRLEWVKRGSSAFRLRGTSDVDNRVAVQRWQAVELNEWVITPRKWGDCSEGAGVDSYCCSRYWQPAGGIQSLTVCSNRPEFPPYSFLGSFSAVLVCCTFRAVRLTIVRIKYIFCEWLCSCSNLNWSQV